VLMLTSNWRVGVFMDLSAFKFQIPSSRNVSQTTFKFYKSIYVITKFNYESSFFLRGIVEAVALLGCHAAFGNCLPTFGDDISVRFERLVLLNPSLICRLCVSVNHSQPSPRDIPEGRRP
jgi:hypothetical protein